MELHRFKVEPIDGSDIKASVYIDGEEIKGCQRYNISHLAGGIPIVTLDFIGIPLYEHDAVITVSSKVDIARVMSKEEFEEFCRIWTRIHKE